MQEKRELKIDKRKKRVVNWKQYNREERHQVWDINDITCKIHRVIDKYRKLQDQHEKEIELKRYLELCEDRQKMISEVPKYRSTGWKIPEFEVEVRNEIERIKTEV